MKKIVIGLVVALSIVAPVAHGQTVDVSTMTQDQLRVYLITLIEQVISLENQLIVMQNASNSTAVAPIPQIAATSITGTEASTTPVVSGGAPAESAPNQTSAPSLAASTPMQPKTISVVFALLGDDGFVTITNDTGVAVRVKNLNVPGGAVAGVTIGQKYGEGFVYPESFTDAVGKTFDMFTCNGLRSLGDAVVPGNSNLDPCARRDAQIAKNELQSGETMIVRYTGTPTGVTYQPGSIVEVESGNDVTF
jgi:hypothetical protein